MKRHDIAFIVLFVMTLSLSIYSLGVSITGHVIQTKFCDQDDCKDFCRSNSDCLTIGEMCCKKGDIGVCEDQTVCEERYIFEPDMDLDFETLTPEMQQPGQIGKAQISLFSIVIGIALIILFIYFWEKKK